MRVRIANRIVPTPCLAGGIGAALVMTGCASLTAPSQATLAQHDVAAITSAARSYVRIALEMRGKKSAKRPTGDRRRVRLADLVSKRRLGQHRRQSQELRV